MWTESPTLGSSDMPRLKPLSDEPCPTRRLLSNADFGQPTSL